MTFGYSDSVVTLSLVSQKNLIVTVTLVSVSFTLRVATIPLPSQSRYL